MEPEQHYLRSLFEPASIAIIGASEQAGSVGQLITRNLIDGRYAGTLYLVNRKHNKVFDRPTVKSIDVVPQRVDLAIICTRAEHIVGIVERCGKVGVRNVLIVTGGYAEAGDAVGKLQSEVQKKARRYGMRLLGPDSLGFMRPAVQLNASNTHSQHGKPGSIALISQSGSLFTAALDWGTESGMACSLVVSMGAECDVDFGEVLDYLVSDPQTKSIFLYIEHIKNARHFMSALRAAARCKPVLLIKVGRNTTVTRAKLAQRINEIGEDDVFDAALHRAGVVRLANLNQMYVAAQALFSNFHPRGNRLAIIVNGSGPGVMAADRATELRIPLAQLLPETVTRLRGSMPAHWLPGNPIDIFSDAEPARYAAALDACLHDERVDGILVMLSPHAHTDPIGTAEAIVQAAATSSKTILACWMGGQRINAALKRMQKAGISVFRTPEPAVELFAQISNYYRAQQLLMQTPASMSGHKPPRQESARLVIESALMEGRKALSTMEAKAILAAFHIPIAQTVMAHSATEAMTLAEEIGLPVVMKVHSPQIRNKMDCGGVRLNLNDLATIHDTYDAILKEVKRCRPDAHIDGISIEPMIQKSHARELMIGMFRDKVFGPTISFGLGGNEIDVNAYERAVALPPLNSFLISDMLRSTRASVRLGEFRKMPPVNMDALQTVLLRVSEMVCELPWIQSLAINPLIIDEHSAVAVDVHIEIANIAPTAGRYDHVAIHPYPAHLTSTFNTADGQIVTIRPIRPEDAEMEQTFIHSLSPESRYLRFMNAIRELSTMQLVRLTQIDYDREMAFVAVISDPAVEIGVARYVTNPDAESCEFAIVVADAWHGKGLARQMMQTLIEAAKNRGLKYMTGDFLSENSRMIHFVQTLGFTITRHPDDSTLKRGVLRLNETPD